MYDVIVIGAGVSGSATARELSRYDLKVGVLEKEEDVCCGTSKANSGIVHAGFDARPGSLMAKMNVRGNQMMEQLTEDLYIPFERNGSLVLCFSKYETNFSDNNYFSSSSSSSISFNLRFNSCFGANSNSTSSLKPTI